MCAGRPGYCRSVSQLAIGNPIRGYDRIADALGNLGIDLSDQSVGNILRERGIPPASESVSAIGPKAGRKVEAEKLSHESVSGPGGEPPAGVDRLSQARTAVEQMTTDQFTEFVLWFTAHHRGRLG